MNNIGISKGENSAEESIYKVGVLSMLFSLLDCIFATCKIQKLQHIASGTNASLFKRLSITNGTSVLPIPASSRNSVEKKSLP